MTEIQMFIKKLLGGKSYSDILLDSLRKDGAVIGEDVHLFGGMRNNKIDTLNPHLLKIGSHVNMVSVRILTHDYAWSVIKRKYGLIFGNQRPVTIGDNVFIGADTVILGGTVIGDNVIIGANSVVSGILESNNVYAGNPAKKIMSLDEYKDKREKRQLSEAKDFFVKYYTALGNIPLEEKFHEYFFLFTGDVDNLNPIFDEKLKLCGNYEESIKALKLHTPLYNSYEEFIDDCMNLVKE